MAIYWWTKAAERGDVVSQYNLGLMYHGTTSPISFDEEKAGYWFAKAARNGDTESKKMLNKWYVYNDKKGKWNKRFEPNTTSNNTNSRNTYNSQPQTSSSTFKSYEQDVRETKIKQFSFVDCSGAYRKWGDTFIDHKGNYCRWGSGFFLTAVTRCFSAAFVIYYPHWVFTHTCKETKF